MVWGIMNLSPSMDRHYINFNKFFDVNPVRMQLVLGTYGAGTRYRFPRGKLFGTGTYIRYLIHQCFTI